MIFLFRMTNYNDYFGWLFRITVPEDYFGCLFQITISGYCSGWLFQMPISDAYFRWLFQMTVPNDYFGCLRMTVSDYCSRWIFWMLVSDEFSGWLFVIPQLIRILTTTVNSYFNQLFDWLVPPLIRFWTTASYCRIMAPIPPDAYWLIVKKINVQSCFAVRRSASLTGFPMTISKFWILNWISIETLKIKNKLSTLDFPSRPGTRLSPVILVKLHEKKSWHYFCVTH